MRAVFYSFGLILLLSACANEKETTPEERTESTDRQPSKDPKLADAIDTAAKQRTAVAKLLAIVAKPKGQLYAMVAATEGVKVAHQEKHATSALIPFLSHEDASVRYLAVLAIGQFEKEGKAAMHPVIALFDDPDHYVRFNAASVAHDFGPQAIPLLIEALDHKSRRVRKQAIIALGFFEEDAKPAARRLSRSIRTDDKTISKLSSGVLARIGTAAMPVVHDLTTALSDRRIHVRANAVEALGWIATREQTKLRVALKLLLEDMSQEVRQATGTALKRIQSREPR